MCKRLMLSCLFMVLCHLSLKAQGICNPDPLTISTVSGQVVESISKGEIPLPEATIQLRKPEYDGQELGRVMSDAEGRFCFTKVKPGQYVLTASYPGLKTFAFRITVVKLPKTQTSKIGLVIGLGSNFNQPCGGGFARLSKTSVGEKSSPYPSKQNTLPKGVP